VGSEKSLRHSVISGMKWLAVTKLLIQLFRWGATFFVIRLLSPEDYGIAAIAGIIPSLLSSLNFLSLGNAIIRFQEENKAILSTLFSVSFLVAILLTLLQILLAPWVAAVYDNEAVRLVLIVTSVIYVLDCMAIQPKALLAKELHYDKLAKIDLLSGIISPVVVLGFALTGWGYWSLSFGLIASSLVRLLACGYYHSLPTRFEFAFAQIRERVKFGVQNSLASLISQTSNTLDIAVGGYLFSSAQIGIYQVGLQVSMIPLRKISPELRRISFPAFSKAATDPGQFRHYFLKSVRMVALVVFPLFWGVGLLAEPLVRLLLTDKWVDSIIIIQIISFVLPFKLFTELNNSVANALGRADLVLSNTLLACVTLALAILLFANIGLPGLAIAWVASILMTFLMLSYRLSHILNLSLWQMIEGMLAPVLGCVLMSAVLLVAKHGLSLPLQLALLPLLGATVYTGYIYVGQRKLWQELRQLIGR